MGCGDGEKGLCSIGGATPVGNLKPTGDKCVGDVTVIPPSGDPDAVLAFSRPGELILMRRGDSGMLDGPLAAAAAAAAAACSTVCGSCGCGRINVGPCEKTSPSGEL